MDVLPIVLGVALPFAIYLGSKIGQSAAFMRHRRLPESPLHWLLGAAHVLQGRQVDTQCVQGQQRGVVWELRLHAPDMGQAQLSVLGLSREIEIRPGKAVHGQDLGDAPFDAAFSCSGRPALLLGLLDASTRQKLLDFHHLHIEVSDAKLSIQIPIFFDKLKLFALLNQLIILYYQLSPRSRQLSYLLARSLGDPVEDIRRHTEILVHEKPLNSMTRSDIYRDAAAEVKIGVLAIFRQDPLLSQLERDAIFLEGLRHGGAAGLHWALVLLQADKRYLTRLFSLYPQENLPSSAWSAVLPLAIQHVDPASVEKTALLMLDHGDADLKQSAIDALAVIGTIQAVPILKTHIRLLTGRSLSRSAQQAIAQIQARAQGGAGGLSVVENGGQLSVVEGGGLSLPARSQETNDQEPT